MPYQDLYAVCIQRAALRLGGYDALAARLKIPAALLERWASGEGSAGESVFLKIVDILLEEDLRTPANRPPDDARRL